MNNDWTKSEVELIVEDYFKMLQIEIGQQKYNKTTHRQLLMPQLDQRSEASVEFKHQNISAVLVDMGLPFIKGYKPRGNYQSLLEDQIINYLKSNRTVLEKDFERFADTSFASSFEKINFETIVNEEPEFSHLQENKPSYKPIKINYLEKEQNNRSLGEQGEKLVIAYERFRLIKAGKESLADKIEWVSKERGDGMGFDILSKNTNGTDRFVEVKTTKLTKEAPIFLSNKEVGFATLNARDFYLYRVYNFSSNPNIFIKNGIYESFCRLVPQSFKGYF